MTGRRGRVLAAAALTVAGAHVGCRDRGPLPFTRVAISPTEGPDTRETTVIIEGDFLAISLDVDLADPGASRVARSVRAALGDRPLGGVRTLRKGSITAVVPRGMDVGTHDLAVTDAEGRTVIVSDAFRVVLGICADAGVGGSECRTTCEGVTGCACADDLSSCEAKCGDGVVRALEEDCDDGNDLDDDGCRNDCSIENGWICEGEPSICSTECGDGNVLPTLEGCDDGNLHSGDGCSSDCRLEEGFTCSSSPSTCGRCGDRVLQDTEACDDGNRTNGDGCSSACTLEEGFCCDGDPPVCRDRPTCGDGVIARDEACDDANALGRDGCGSCCQIEPGFTCFGSPSECFTSETATFVDGENRCPGDGTFESPFCTITLALEGLHQDIVIRPAHYNESVDIQGGAFRLIGLGEAEAAALLTSEIALHIRGGAQVEIHNLRIQGDVTAVLIAGEGTEALLSACTIGPSLGTGLEVTDAARLVLTRSTLTGNGDSALILATTTPYEVTNNFIVGNIGPASPSSAVLIEHAAAGSRFSNNTLADNRAALEGASAIRCLEPAEIVNSIIWGSTTAKLPNEPVFEGVCSFRYSDLGVASAPAVTMNGNFSAPPSFIGGGNYHLREGSRCIDAADPSGVRPRGPAPPIDFDGDARPAHGGVDVGADEVP